MNRKPYGFRGTLEPKDAFKNLKEDLYFDNISVSIIDSIFEVSYEQKNQKENALRLANSLIASWSKRNNIQIKIDFNHAWELKAHGNKFAAINLHEEIKASERIQIYTNTVQIQIGAYVINPSDNYSFTNDIETAKKAGKNKTLELALKYIHEEVIDNKRPLYGIHKAIEQIIKTLPGKNEDQKRNYLASISGQSRSYIDDLMTSIQTQRHSEEWLKLNNTGKIIDENECKTRAINLVNAYEKSLS